MLRLENHILLYFAIPLIFIIAWYLYRGKKNQESYKAIGSHEIKRFILTRIDFRKINFKSFFFIIATILLFIASMGPQIGTRLKKINKKAIDIYILLDTSVSMDATDVSPSRIKKAIIELNRFVDNLKGDRVGIIIFAETAHIHCPLTTDYKAVKLFLNSINTKMIYAQGTNIYSAIDLAINNISGDEDKYKTILLISDGEEHENDNKNIINKAKERGINIHTLGVGSIRGSPIPIYNKNGDRIDFKKNKEGNIITSTLNENFLHNIAKETGGIFVRIQNEFNAINPIVNEINNMDKREVDHYIYSEYENRFQWFLFISLIFFIIEFLISTNNQKKYIWKGKFRK